MALKKIIITKDYKNLRLDKALTFFLKGCSRTHIQDLIKKNKIKVNAQHKAASYQLRVADVVDVVLEEKETAPITLVSKDIPIIYEDKYVLLVNKPPGLIVHPAGKDKESLIGALLCKKIKLSSIQVTRPGVVHRLDKDTSGIMVLAKDNASHLKLVEEFRERCIEKEYIALVKGIFKEKKGIINLPLKRLKYKPKMKVSFLASKKSLTLYEVLDEKNNISLIRLNPKTGRMHQLRVHLSFLGHSIIGDKKYKGPKASRLYLHSQKIGFYHPITGKFLEFRVPAPPSFKKYLNTRPSLA